MERTHGGRGEKTEEEGAAHRSWCGLPTTSIPHPLVLLRAGQGDVEEARMKQ